MAAPSESDRKGAEGFALTPKGDATERLWGRTE
ncbi:hypothetical protein GGR46_002677 [Sphingomonas kyeonggiensis]|uniref:Uncharacterized protein n=1 Tax=Sphingomonas kyeonggiensis TaxID=1268553 RepID=A0A7W6NXC1_9SPHN|nr:hypothetical protein [Sphingomonas kyeonggiensis]